MDIKEIEARFALNQDTMEDMAYLIGYCHQLRQLVDELENNIPKELIEENIALKKALRKVVDEVEGV